MPTLAIVGAGPVGIFAALAAEARGFAVTVFEAEQPGAALLRWGPTRFFSPFRMNVPWWARAHLPKLPADDALLTGPEFVADVLAPLCADLDVRRAHVVAIARDRLLRDEYPGNPVRGQRPFSLLVRGDDGETLHSADRVLDCSGVALPCGIGPGGLPAPGEAALGERVIRTLGALDHALPALVGKRVLVVGAGHTAARAIERLAPIATVIWCVRRGNQQPIVEVSDDPLPERRARVAAANELAQTLTVERRATIVSVKQLDHRLVIELANDTTHPVDAIVAATGARPDHALTAALPIAIDPPTEGAARLMRALGSLTDCLTVPKLAPGDLDSGEPGFSLGGQKSYGRARTFLLQSGYQQMEQILDGWRR